MQGKHREQEQESKGKLPRRKDQVRGTGDTGPPPQKEFDRIRMQGKNLEQEQEPQRVLPRRKSQLRGTGTTGRPSQKEFEGCRLQGKLLEQEQESQGAEMIKEEAREPDESEK